MFIPAGKELCRGVAAAAALLLPLFLCWLKERRAPSPRKSLLVIQGCSFLGPATFWYQYPNIFKELLIVHSLVELLVTRYLHMLPVDLNHIFLKTLLKSRIIEYRIIEYPKLEGPHKGHEVQRAYTYKIICKGRMIWIN